jgi:predicted NBD/HSP70 family sugar kinase
MDHFAGLDVSVKKTSVCIVDDMGKIVREVKVDSPCQLGAVHTWPTASLAVMQQIGRWGNRPASLWIAEDFGCCASG